MNKVAFIESQTEQFIDAVLQDGVEIDEETISIGVESTLKHLNMSDFEIYIIVEKIVDRVFEEAASNKDLTISNYENPVVTRALEGREE